MKNLAFGILGFALGILVFTTVNKGNLFTDASQSGTDLIEQLDGILSNPKFNDREYSLAIIDKTDTLSAIFEEDSIPYLAMKYINVKLSSKVKAMPVPVVEDIVDEVVVAEEDEAFHNAAELEEEKEDVTTKTTTSDYQNGFLLPTKKEKAAPTGKAVSDEELSGFNVGRKSAPAAPMKSERKKVTNSHSYVYKVDSDMYDLGCAQLRCMETCINLSAGYSEATCKKECVSDVCIDVKKNGRLESRKIDVKSADQM